MLFYCRRTLALKASSAFLGAGKPPRMHGNKRSKIIWWQFFDRALDVFNLAHAESLQP
jgi:hypothetical protein